MITPHAVWYRMRALVRRRDVERDVNDELAFHIDMETEQLVASGVARSEARARAMRRFGDATRVREECLDERGVRPIEDFAQDLRVGARILRRSPGVATVSMITLAIGIAAATTIFSVVDGVLLKPFPYEDAGRLVTVRQRSLRDGALDDAAPGDFLDWRERTRTLEHLSAADPYSMDHRTDEGMTSLPMWLVSSEFFPLVGTPARLGRTFRPDEFVPGSDRVIVLGDAVWRERFAADSAIVGKTITLDGAPFVVVGVMPRSFHWPPGRDTWVPLTITEEDRTVRTGGWWSVIGRLRPGTTIDGARRELSNIAAELAALYPATNRDTGIEITPLEDALLGSSRAALAMLAAAVVLLLLIACANVANVVLGRSIARAREFAIRGAMGARPERLARQMITEVLLVAVLGTVLGVLAATWALDLVRTLGPRDVPRIDELAIDARVIVFAAFAAIVVAMLAGALPAIWVARGNLSEALKEGGRTSTSGPRTNAIRATLAIGQVTLATMLLVGAGLLARSFVSLLRVDRGYDTTNVVVGTVQAWQHYREPERRAEFVRQALDRLRGAPGVHSVGVTSSLPLSPRIGADDAGYVLEDQARPVTSEWPSVHLAIIAGSYFDALRTPVRRGRSFNDRDRANTPPVMIINEAFARRHFPHANPIGRRVVLNFTRMDNERTREIVGVVGDMRHEGLHAAPQPTVFLPHAQLPFGALTFVVRAQGNPGAALRALRAELTAVNSAMPVEDPTTLDARLEESLRARRFHLALLVTFALAALVLAAVGVYGVVSHATAERTHEIGVRMALGAQVHSIIGAVMRGGLTMVGAGVLLGAIGAAAAGSAMSGMLFQTTAHDAATYALVALVIMVTSIVATAVPAMRAVRVEPTEALRGL
jgi:putative ABC transport system permease protein